ncbi:MAG TPA: hypothetical protein VIT22_10510 [Pseudoxanthomonas sp.]
MIRANKLRELTLGSPSTPQRARHVSAASGVVVVGEFLYVVADDEHHLGVFRAEGDGEGDLLRIFPGDLPHDRKPRKAGKPDLEALTRLPPFPGYPAGALLALASGSRPNRRSGAVCKLDSSGALAGAPRLIDLSDVYLPLERHFPALNIEGAVIVDDALVLLQRGSKHHPANALIRLPLAGVLDAIAHQDSLGTVDSPRVHIVDLGTADGVPLCFTDGTALADGRIVFTAVAENAEDTYNDGPCSAAAVGILDAEGRVLVLEPLEPAYKVEGVHARIDGGVIKLLLATDADDPDIAGILLAAELPSCFVS